MAEKTEDELMAEASERVREYMQQKEGTAKEAPSAEPESAAESPAETTEPTEPASEVVETSDPPAEPAEPFEGYNALPEAVRKRWDEMNAKASEAEKARAAEAEWRQKYEAQHGRVAPLQRQLDQLQRERAQRPAQTQPQHSLSVEDWIKTLSPGMRTYLDQFPDEAKAQFEIARDVAERQAAALSGQLDQKVHEIERRAELAVLAREHPDFRDYTLSQGAPTSQKGAAFWQWLPTQPEHIQAMARSNSAEDISAAISLHKWEGRPEVRAMLEEMRHPVAQEWLASQPSAIASLMQSPRVDDRIGVLRLFDQHLRLQEVGKAPDPQTAARVSQIAARREQQGKASPSIRQTVAPHGAATDGEDAGWAAAVAAARKYQR